MGGEDWVQTRYDAQSRAARFLHVVADRLVVTVAALPAAFGVVAGPVDYYLMVLHHAERQVAVVAFAGVVLTWLDRLTVPTRAEEPAAAQTVDPDGRLDQVRTAAVVAAFANDRLVWLHRFLVHEAFAAVSVALLVVLRPE